MTWKERGYKDTRERPDRNQRRFFMLEQNAESEKLMAEARAQLAKEKGVPADSIPFAQVMRAALKKLAGCFVGSVGSTS